MGACVGWAILSIVAEKMTPKTLCQGTSRGGSKSVRARKYLSGGGEYTSAIREMNMLGDVSGDWESSVVGVG